MAAFGPADYVTVYSGSGYAGSFAHLSQNYDALAMIGWNDTISSYRARNNRRGPSYQHWFAGGSTKQFAAMNVPSLPVGRRQQLQLGVPELTRVLPPPSAEGPVAVRSLTAKLTST